jgi:hypothetical protein
LGQWQFFAVTRQSDDSIKFFYNGALTKEITARGGTGPSNSGPIGTIYQHADARLQIGRDAQGNDFKG